MSLAFTTTLTHVQLIPAISAKISKMAHVGQLMVPWSPCFFGSEVQSLENFKVVKLFVHALINFQQNWVAAASAVSVHEIKYFIDLEECLCNTVVELVKHVFKIDLSLCNVLLLDHVLILKNCATLVS